MGASGKIGHRAARGAFFVPACQSGASGGIQIFSGVGQPDQRGVRKRAEDCRSGCGGKVRDRCAAGHFFLYAAGGRVSSGRLPGQMCAGKKLGEVCRVRFFFPEYFERPDREGTTLFRTAGRRAESVPAAAFMLRPDCAGAYFHASGIFYEAGDRRAGGASCQLSLQRV